MRSILFVLICLMMATPVLAAEIVAARFTEPTERYTHCVLGDCVEYEAVEAVMKDGRVLSFRLGADSVFEDITPRLVPFGVKGRNVILVVRSYLTSGAALTVLDVQDGVLRIVAESRAIGTAHRWQNPVGVADFDGDGRMEIASVITPHIGGTLTLFERRGNQLVEDGRAHGYSNHLYGSGVLDLHEILDWNGDDIPDIVLPDAGRRVLKVVSFASGNANILAERSFDVAIDGPVTAVQTGVALVLESGKTVYWPLPTQ